MTTKHTSGPWHKTPFENRGYLILHDNLPLAHVKEIKKGNEEANARLIAAAPDLLQCLIDLYHNSDCKDEKLLEEVQEIIKKATGDE